MSTRARKFLGRPLALWSQGITACINLGIVFELYHWTELQIAATNLTAGALLALAANASAGDE